MVAGQQERIIHEPPKEIRHLNLRRLPRLILHQKGKIDNIAGRNSGYRRISLFIPRAILHRYTTVPPKLDL